MKTIQITNSIKIQYTDDTGVVKAANFSVGHQPYAFICESQKSDEDIRKQIHKRFIMTKINSMKDTDMVKIGDYQIICEVRGNERTVYANDEVISNRQV